MLPTCPLSYLFTRAWLSLSACRISDLDCGENNVFLKVLYTGFCIFYLGKSSLPTSLYHNFGEAETEKQTIIY
jgi:hypothetical protein